METPRSRTAQPRTKPYETLVPKCHVLSQEDCNLFLNAGKFLSADVLQRVISDKPAWRKIDGVTQRTEKIFGEPKILYDRYDAGERVRLVWSQRSHRIVFACGNNEYIPKPGDLLDDRTFMAKLAAALQQQSRAALRPQVELITATNAASIAHLIEATALPGEKTAPYDLFKGYQQHASEREAREGRITPPAAPDETPRMTRAQWMRENAWLLGKMRKADTTWKVRDPVDGEWWTVYISSNEDVTGYKGKDGDVVPVPWRILWRISRNAEKSLLDKEKTYVYPAVSDRKKPS